MDKFNNKYRIPSARHPHWDYGNNGAYFITVCVQNREYVFGDCIDGKMKLSTIGAIVQGFWYEIPRHFDFVELGEFIVMPNHIHGVLILDKNIEIGQSKIETGHCVETGHCPVSTTPTDNDKTIGQKRFRNQGKNTVSSIIGSFKSICTKHIRQTFPEIDFKWQERFWDNIIRDGTAFENITNYIINNPKNWENDRFKDDKSFTNAKND